MCAPPWIHKHLHASPHNQDHHVHPGPPQNPDLPFNPRACRAQVDGKSSVACYLMALDRCYASLCEKFERQRRRAASANGSGPSGAPSPWIAVLLHLWKCCADTRYVAARSTPQSAVLS